jgi:serine/threonine-protein kinase
LDPIFRRGLAKKPEERYASCTELVDALEQAIALTPAPSTPASEPRKALAAAGIAALLALAAGGFWWLARPRPHPDAAAVPAAARAGEPSAGEPSPAVSAAAPASTPKPARETPPRPSARPPEPKPVAAAEPKAASPPPPAPESDVPARTAIWSGALAPGAEVTFGAGGPSAGALTLELPSAFLVDRVTPKVAEIVEAPSAANGWSRLRIRNSGSQTLDLVTIRFRPRP